MGELVQVHRAGRLAAVGLELNERLERVVVDGAMTQSHLIALIASPSRRQATHVVEPLFYITLGGPGRDAIGRVEVSCTRGLLLNPAVGEAFRNSQAPVNVRTTRRTLTRVTANVEVTTTTTLRRWSRSSPTPVDQFERLPRAASRTSRVLVMAVGRRPADR